MVAIGQSDIIERGLKNTYSSFNENTFVENLEKFILQCDEAVIFLKSQLEQKSVVGTEESIETKIRQVMGLQTVIKKMLSTSDDDIEFKEI